MRDYQIHCPQCAAPNWASEERCSACGAQLRASRGAAGRVGLPPLVSPSGRPMPEFEEEPRAEARLAPPVETSAPSPLQAPPPGSRIASPGLLPRDLEKYPHLRRRLKWMRFAADHTLFLFLVLGLLTTVSPFFIPFPGPSWLRFLGLPLGVLCFVPGWFIYLYQQTQIDVLELLLDMEETIRRLAEWMVQEEENVRERT